MNIALTRLIRVGTRGILVTDKINSNKNYYLELKNLLKIRRAKNCSFTRLGKSNDG